MTYQIILADPPWSYNYSKAKTGNDKAGRGCANSQYSLLTNKSIQKMRPVIDKIADPQGSILFLWSSGALLEDCMSVLCRWGYTYKTMAVWTKHCRDRVDKDRLGVGYWFRSNAEPILVGVRGKKPPTRRTNASNHITEEEEIEQLSLGHIRSEGLRHSEKPDTLQKIIEKTWPEQRKAELFARRNRPGWDAWGNEAPQCAPELLDAFGGATWVPPSD
jgi:N6-adenosine-specific RNA methylase IME4